MWEPRARSPTRARATSSSPSCWRPTPPTSTSTPTSPSRPPAARCTWPTRRGTSRASPAAAALGLGTQIRPHIERRYGAEWSKPVARMREIVGATKEIFRAWQEQDRLDFRGAFFTLTLMPRSSRRSRSTPDHLRSGSGRGAQDEPMVCETADCCSSTRSTAGASSRSARPPRSRPGSRRRAVTAASSPSSPKRSCCWRNDEERKRAEDGGRFQLAFYGSTPAYRPVLDIEGYGDLQPELNRLTKEEVDRDVCPHRPGPPRDGRRLR